MRKITTAKLKKKLDTQWSKQIRIRDPICCKCKKAKSTQAAHIFSRNNMSVRWDLRNGIGMCFYCHLYWAHRNPIEFTEWIKAELGKKYLPLRRKSLQLKQWSRKELEELYK